MNDLTLKFLLNYFKALEVEYNRNSLDIDIIDKKRDVCILIINRINELKENHKTEYSSEKKLKIKDDIEILENEIYLNLYKIEKPLLVNVLLNVFKEEGKNQVQNIGDYESLIGYKFMMINELRFGKYKLKEGDKIKIIGMTIGGVGLNYVVKNYRIKSRDFLIPVNLIDSHVDPIV